MSAKMWYTKQDVMNDLAEYTGIRIGDFEEDYIVRGEKPPPLRVQTDEDDEFELRFGRGDAQAPPGDNLEPDLAGITQMLRLVDTFDAPEDQSKKIQKKEKPRKKKTLEQSIVISKLNPNVDEFVPRSAQNVSPVNNNTSKDDNNKTNNEIDKETLAIHQEPENDEEIEKKKMVAALKSKIAAASKDDSLEKKRDRNVAIAALMRLNSVAPEMPNSTPSPTPPQPKTAEPPKISSPKPVLFTPDYFAGPSNSPMVLKVDDREHTIPEKPLLLTPSSSSSKDSLDPQVRESIEKVKNWLSSPDKKIQSKPVAPLTEPVMFRKKGSVATPKSPSSSDVSKKTGSAYATFVPSQYAKELAKTFENRVKEKEKNKPAKNIWEKLEDDLKAKDEIIKKRRREQAKNDASNPTSSCSS